MTRTLPILCALAACSGQSGLLIEISVRDAELAADLDRVVVRVEEAGQMMRQAELLKNGSEPPLFAERTVERVLYPTTSKASITISVQAWDANDSGNLFWCQGGARFHGLCSDAWRQMTDWQ